MHACTPAGVDQNTWFDIKLIHQQAHVDVDLNQVPPVFLPAIGHFRLFDYDGVYAARPDDDIFELRGVNRRGAIVVVRQDHYVAHVLPLAATGGRAEFIALFTLDQQGQCPDVGTRAEFS